MLKSVISFSLSVFVFFNLFAQNQKETIVEISTSQGTIKVKLYNETPVHRDNFIILVKQGKYDETDFYRIINTHFIQGGNPELDKTMKTLPAEISPEKFCKRGALVAAREDESVNPEKRSSATSFYIVLGNTIAYELVDRIGNRMEYKFSEEQKQAYSTVGGIPTLDGSNTVFGEVIEGLDVVGKIASQPVQGETPDQKITLKMKIVE